MHTSLQSIYTQIEADLDKLFEELSGLSHDKLSVKPKNGGWSVLEVIQHLVMVEKSSLAYLKKKSKYPETFKKAGMANGLRKMALRFFLDAPFKFKAPKFVDDSQFDPSANLGDLKKEWRNARTEMTDFLDKMPDEYLNKLIFRHAVAGRLTPDAMLIFIRDHFRRHRRQIDRIFNE